MVRYADSGGNREGYAHAERDMRRLEAAQLLATVMIVGKVTNIWLYKNFITKHDLIFFLLLMNVSGLSGCRHTDFASHVHLSFDDGASTEVTMQILSTLARYRAPASFFEVGSHLAALPDHGRALLTAKRAGAHVIG